MLGLGFAGMARNATSYSQFRNLLRRDRWDRFKARHEKKDEDRNISPEEREIIDSIHRQLQAENTVKSERLCVECHRPFIIITVNGIEIDYCPMCRGCWFDVGELQTLSKLGSDVPSDHLKCRESRYKCPVCQAVMREHVYLAPHNLLVDQCPRGHGVYLENKELERVFEIN